MRTFFYLVLFILLTGFHKSSAQNYPVYNSYYVNPYLYNPAEAATDYTYIFINHRQQWTGVEGAPVVSTLNVNSMINQSHAGIGAKISSFKRGLLSTTDLSLTYAYGVALDQKNTLFFGLSGGAISNTVDVNNLSSNVNPSDPAIQNYLLNGNNLQPTANFGMLYRSSSGFNLGVTLPQLFAPKFTDSNFSNTAFVPTDNFIVSAYYKRRVEGKIVSKTKKGVRSRVKTNGSYAPLEFYVLYKYAKAGNSQFEVLGKLNLSENFWLGATYRQAYGFAGITGFNVKQFIFSYSYELGGQPESGFSSGTHEIQIGLRLGQQKKFRRVVPVLHSTIKSTKESHTARFQQTVEDTDNIGGAQKTEKKKYYVVIKVFPDFTGADAFKKKLIEQKYNADIFYYPKDKKYYVHVLESSKSSEAFDEARNLKNYTKLKEARVLTVESPK